MKKNVDWEKIARLLEHQDATEEENLGAEEHEALNQAQKLWEQSKVLGKKRALLSGEQVAMGKAKIWERIAQESHTDTVPVVALPKKKPLWPTIAKIAATLLLPVALYLAWPKTNNPSRFEGSITASLENNTQSKALSLPDGSDITLTAGKLTYTFDQAQNTRSLSLNGNAFLNIAKNKEYPFVIENEHAQVKVLGTSFQLNMNPTDNEVYLSVNTGKVAFKGLGDKSWGLIHATKGDEVSLDKSSHTIKKSFADKEHYISYNNSYLAFDATLEQLCVFLTDWSNTETVEVDGQIAQIGLTSTQGLVYSDVYSLLQKAILPISDMVVLSKEGNHISIQKK